MLIAVSKSYFVNENAANTFEISFFSQSLDNTIK